EPTEDDIQMKDFIEYYNLPYSVIATKCDKIPRGKWNQHFYRIKKALNLPSDESLIMFSKETGEGFEKAWTLIEGILAEYDEAAQD
ncbi:MAG: YihA family ribosome biogenesis GTP-binding protein, partial [Trichococcus flocculiformis]